MYPNAPITNHSSAAVTGLLCCLLFSWCAVAADDAEVDAEAAQSAADRNQVLASVEGVPIQLGEVRQELHAALSDRRPEASDEPRLVREMLQQIVRRRLALAALVAENRAVSDRELNRTISTHRDRLMQRGDSLKAHLQRSGVPIQSYRQRVRWEQSWVVHKSEMLTEENLIQFFERHQRHFDGTEVRASHLLLRVGPAVPAGNAEKGTGDREQGTGDKEQGAGGLGQVVDYHDTNNVKAAETRAQEIRGEIEAGGITFAEAAARYSDAPSKDRGGDIGFFPRRGVMHEAFAAAAFGLERDQVSQPIVTPFGVHLIKVTDEKPGDRDYADVRDVVYRAAEARLFDALVARGRATAKVEYTQ